jgi:hypothetical protein
MSQPHHRGQQAINTPRPGPMLWPTRRCTAGPAPAALAKLQAWPAGCCAALRCAARRTGPRHLSHVEGHRPHPLRRVHDQRRAHPAAGAPDRSQVDPLPRRRSSHTGAHTPPPSARRSIAGSRVWPWPAAAAPSATSVTTPPPDRRRRHWLWSGARQHLGLLPGEAVGRWAPARPPRRAQRAASCVGAGAGIQHGHWPQHGQRQPRRKHGRGGRGGSNVRTGGQC